MTAPVKRGAFRRSCRKCGWTTVAETAGFADRRKRQHNCDRQPVCPDCKGPKSHVAKRCQKCAEQARFGHIDRTPKPCLHKHADHQHGTYAAFTLDGCRCEPCSEATHAYNDTLRKTHAYGRWGERWVDSEQVREHIRSLMAQGMGAPRIRKVGGISSGTWTKLWHGQGGRPPSKRTSRALAERVLAIPLDVAPGARVSSLGASRRLQALVALGWSQAKLAAELGMLPSNFTPVVHGRRDVLFRHDQEIRALYERLSMTLPPEDEWRDRIASSRARRYAKEHGWAPPLAWDDDQLDDPAYRPKKPAKDRVTGYDHAVVEQFIETAKRPRRLSKQETAEALRRLRLRGVSTHDIEHRYGLKPERYKESA